MARGNLVLVVGICMRVVRHGSMESEALESLEQCAQRLVLSSTDGIGGTTMLW